MPVEVGTKYLGEGDPEPMRMGIETNREIAGTEAGLSVLIRVGDVSD
jgi:hypothetical protein